MRNSYLITFEIMHNQPREKFLKKLLLKILQYFRIMRSFLEHLLWRASTNGCFWKCSWNWEKCKTVDKDFNSTYKTGFFNISKINKWNCISLCLCFMIGFLWSLYLHKYFFDVVRNKLYSINIYIRVDKEKIKSSRK